MSEKTIRCTDCAAEFTEEELEGKSGCPTCGTPSLPCSIANDVSLQINWHELRVISIWASSYAEEKFPNDPGCRTLKSILARLEAQFPDKAPLSLEGELRAIAKMGIGDVEVHNPDGTSKKYKMQKPD